MVCDKGYVNVHLLSHNTYHLLVFSLEFYHISPLLKINREFAVA